MLMAGLLRSAGPGGRRDSVGEVMDAGKAASRSVMLPRWELERRRLADEGGAACDWACALPDNPDAVIPGSESCEAVGEGWRKSVGGGSRVFALPLPCRDMATFLREPSLLGQRHSLSTASK